MSLKQKNPEATWGLAQNVNPALQNHTKKYTTWLWQRILRVKVQEMWNINVIAGDHQTELGTFSVLFWLSFFELSSCCLGSASCIKKIKAEEKEGELYFTNKLKCSLVCSSTTDCSTFWWSIASFEAGRYVLIIWFLNDDTQFIINGPYPSTLPSCISALAIFCTIWSFCNYTSFCSSHCKLFVK